MQVRVANAVGLPQLASSNAKQQQQQQLQQLSTSSNKNIICGCFHQTKPLLYLATPTNLFLTDLVSGGVQASTMINPAWGRLTNLWHCPAANSLIGLFEGGIHGVFTWHSTTLSLSGPPVKVRVENEDDRRPFVSSSASRVDPFVFLCAPNTRWITVVDIENRYGFKLKGSRKPVVSVCAHPTVPGVLASCSVDGEVRLWDYQNQIALSVVENAVPPLLVASAGAVAGGVGVVAGTQGYAMAFDANHLVVAHPNGTVVAWALPSLSSGSSSSTTTTTATSATATATSTTTGTIVRSPSMMSDSSSDSMASSPGTSALPQGSSAATLPTTPLNEAMMTMNWLGSCQITEEFETVKIHPMMGSAVPLLLAIDKHGNCTGYDIKTQQPLKQPKQPPKQQQLLIIKHSNRLGAFNFTALVTQYLEDTVPSYGKSSLQQQQQQPQQQESTTTSLLIHPTRNYMTCVPHCAFQDASYITRLAVFDLIPSASSSSHHISQVAAAMMSPSPQDLVWGGGKTSFIIKDTLYFIGAQEVFAYSLSTKATTKIKDLSPFIYSDDDTTTATTHVMPVKLCYGERMGVIAVLFNNSKCMLFRTLFPLQDVVVNDVSDALFIGAEDEHFVGLCASNTARLIVGETRLMLEGCTPRDFQLESFCLQSIHPTPHMSGNMFTIVGVIPETMTTKSQVVLLKRGKNFTASHNMIPLMKGEVPLQIIWQEDKTWNPSAIGAILTSTGRALLVSEHLSLLCSVQLTTHQNAHCAFPTPPPIHSIMWAGWALLYTTDTHLKVAFSDGTASTTLLSLHTHPTALCGLLPDRVVLCTSTLGKPRVYTRPISLLEPLLHGELTFAKHLRTRHAELTELSDRIYQLISRFDRQRISSLLIDRLTDCGLAALSKQFSRFVAEPRQSLVLETALAANELEQSLFCLMEEGYSLGPPSDWPSSHPLRARLRNLAIQCYLSGQPELAKRCFDLAGDSTGLLFHHIVINNDPAPLASIPLLPLSHTTITAAARDLTEGSSNSSTIKTVKRIKETVSTPFVSSLTRAVARIDDTTALPYMFVDSADCCDVVVSDEQRVEAEEMCVVGPNVTAQQQASLDPTADFLRALPFPEIPAVIADGLPLDEMECKLPNSLSLVSTTQTFVSEKHEKTSTTTTAAVAGGGGTEDVMSHDVAPSSVARRTTLLSSGERNRMSLFRPNNHLASPVLLNHARPKSIPVNYFAPINSPTQTTATTPNNGGFTQAKPSVSTTHQTPTIASLGMSPLVAAANAMKEAAAATASTTSTSAWARGGLHTREDSLRDLRMAMNRKLSSGPLMLNYNNNNTTAGGGAATTGGMGHRRVAAASAMMSEEQQDSMKEVKEQKSQYLQQWEMKQYDNCIKTTTQTLKTINRLMSHTNTTSASTSSSSNELIKECRQAAAYKVASSMSQATTATNNNKSASALIAAYVVTCLPLQPEHTAGCIKWCVDKNMQAGNYGVASRLIQLSPSSATSTALKDLLYKCEAQGCCDSSGVDYTCPACDTKTTTPHLGSCMRCKTPVRLCCVSFKLLSQQQQQSVKKCVVCESVFDPTVLVPSSLKCLICEQNQVIDWVIPKKSAILTSNSTESDLAAVATATAAAAAGAGAMTPSSTTPTMVAMMTIMMDGLKSSSGVNTPTSPASGSPTLPSLPAIGVMDGLHHKPLLASSSGADLGDVDEPEILISITPEGSTVTPSDDDGPH